MNKLLASIHPRLVELAKKIDLGDKPDYPTCSPCGDAPSGPYYPTFYVSGRKEPIDLPDKGKATVEYRVRNRSSNKRDEGDERHSVDIEVHSIEPIEGDKRPKEGQPATLLDDIRRLRLFARGDIYARTIHGVNNTIPVWEHSSLRGGNVQHVQAGQLKAARRIKQQIRAYGGNIERAIGKLKSELSCVPAFLTEFTSDPRARNSLGEYTSDAGEGVDPNQMAAAYGPPEVSQSHLERVKNFFLKRRQAAASAPN